MPLQKMSTKEVLGDTPTHFFKSGGALRANNYSGLVALTALLPQDRKVEYDLWYDMNDEAKVHGYVYTDMASQFLYIRPACTVRTYQTMVEAANGEITEEGELLLDKMRLCADKYRLRKSKTNYDFVVFLPGSNIFNKIAKIEKLQNAVSQGAKCKLHPLSAAPMVAHLKHKLGCQSLLTKNLSGHEFMTEASIVGSFTNSEMGLVAAALGKTVYLFNDVTEMYTYSPIYNAVFPGGIYSEDRMKRVLSCKSSGLISVHADNPQENIDLFFRRFEDLDVRLPSS